MFASAVDSRQATVRLTAPPPLETEFHVSDDGAGWRVVAGSDGPIARVRRWEVPADLEPLPRVPAASIEEGRGWWRENVFDGHPFPTCFGCGHLRPDRDGLELHAGAVAGSDICADAWTPAVGETDDWWVWAAVDCPSGSAAGVVSSGLTPAVLGEMSLAITNDPMVGVEYQVVGRFAGREGRKLMSDVALVAPDGENIARGRAVWIRLSDDIDEDERLPVRPPFRR